MKKKIFKSIVSTVLLVSVVCFALVMGALYRYFSEQNLNQMKMISDYLRTVVEQSGREVLNNLPENQTMRITLVAPDGTVLFDSRADAEDLDNHQDRDEIEQALQDGEGQSVRYSSTMAEKTVNYAVRLTDGNVLRVSSTQITVVTLLYRMMVSIFLILIVAVGLSMVLASRIAERVTAPINQIDLENPDEQAVYEELRPLVCRLQAQNRQITRQMDALKEEHERQDLMRREFTANVSHELKTPLTSISGFAEIIRDGFVKPEDIPHFADTIYKEAQRLIVLVSDIIKLSRLEGGELVVQKELVDLYTVCEEEIEHLKAAAKTQNIHFHLSGEHQVVYGSRQILGEIVYNLCDNAIKYNQQGGIVKVSVAHRQNKAVLSVSDTGIGIPKEELSRVFERFYRVNKSHSKEIGGTGLGLSIVKHGVAFHGGEIQIESELGKGTTIRILFSKEE